MADPTPPSDLPDPASPNPENAKPGTPTGKRIRSLPDRVVKGSVANVRSVPDRVVNSSAANIRSVPTSGEGPRPSGTYAASLGKERSWKRGLNVLWVFFLVVMALEALRAIAYLFAGKVGWPPVNYLLLSHGPVLPVDLIRLALLCTFFIGLWVGQSWLRYFFGLVSLLSSTWLFALLIVSYHAAGKFKATGETDVPILTSQEVKLTVALAIIYLVCGVYVFFSSDQEEFTLHRRASGRVWGLLLATVVAFGSLAAIIILPQPYYAKGVQKQREGAVAFGEETLKKMSESWDPTSIDDRIDPGFATGFTPAARQTTFANFKDLGRLRDPHTAPAAATPAPAPDPLNKIPSAPADAPISVSRNADGSLGQTHACYDTTGATFEHGSVRFILDLVRDASGPWRIAKLDAKDVNIERPKRATPPPVATPAPDGTTPSPAPDGTAPSPSPAATASTATTDATAPTPAATPAPGVPAAPTPAASVTPAAMPSPSTGG